MFFASFFEESSFGDNILLLVDGSPSNVFSFFAGGFLSSGLAFLEGLGVVLVGGLFLSLLDVRVISQRSS